MFSGDLIGSSSTQRLYLLRNVLFAHPNYSYYENICFHKYKCLEIIVSSKQKNECNYILPLHLYNKGMLYIEK